MFLIMGNKLKPRDPRFSLSETFHISLLVCFFKSVSERRKAIKITRLLSHNTMNVHHHREDAAQAFPDKPNNNNGDGNAIVEFNFNTMLWNVVRNLIKPLFTRTLLLTGTMGTAVSVSILLLLYWFC